MSWQIDAQTMNAETITAICYLYIFGAVIASIWAAQILEKRLKTRLPQTLPYRWGYYFGCMGLACAPFALFFACAVIIFASYDKAELVGEYLVYTAYCGFQALCGWFIIKRRWWAWVFGTIFSFNIVLWIINGIYGHNRRKELSKKAEIQVAPAPLPELARTPDGILPRKAKLVNWAVVCVGCGIVAAILFFALRAPKYISTDPNAGTAAKDQIQFTPDKEIDLSGLPDKGPLSPAEIFRRGRPSVVLLEMQDARGQPISLGSGFFIDKDVVATNFHVIEGAAVGYAKVTGQKAKLNIKGTGGVDPLHDLALLQIDGSSTQHLSVAPNLSVNIGDAVYAIGNPQGLEGTFSQGIISSVRTLGSDRLLQITAPISPGSSGGPVLDQTGTVVGVSFASIEKGQNLNFAIPSDYLAALQLTKTELRPFTTVPRAKARTTLLDRIGNEHPLAGVVGENFTWGGAYSFSFSLHNKLAEGIAGVHGFVIFYSPEGEPLDSWPINYEGTIPAHAAKRINGEVGADVHRLWESTYYYWWDAHARASRKTTSIIDVPYEARRQTRTEHSEGKVEFRILDFAVD
jgi:hypothetical protein